MAKTFALKAVKFNAGILDCKYRLTDTANGDYEVQEHHVKNDRYVHEDLLNLFEKDLVDILTDVFDVTQFHAEALNEDGENTLCAYGITFTGDGDKRSAKIAGGIKTKYGVINFTTPRIRFGSTKKEDSAGERLKAIEVALTREVEAYLFNGKSAEVSVFDEEN